MTRRRRSDLDRATTHLCNAIRVGDPLAIAHWQAVVAVLDPQLAGRRRAVEACGVRIARQ